MKEKKLKSVSVFLTTHSRITLWNSVGLWTVSKYPTMRYIQKWRVRVSTKTQPYLVLNVLIVNHLSTSLTFGSG